MQKSSPAFSGGSTPGPSNKAAGETMTMKRTKPVLGTAELKRSKE
jgi:hypothetical protein